MSFSKTMWTLVALTAMVQTVCASPLSFMGSNEVLKPYPNPEDVIGAQNDYQEAYYYQIYADMTNSGSAKYGREGNATTTSSCDVITHVPHALRSSRNMRPAGISKFYQKYTEAYGVPVLGSNNVPDAAMRRACYVLKFLLADRSDVRNAYFKNYGRVGIIGVNEKTTSIPEYRFLSPKRYARTRGLGAIPIAPISTAGAENILCLVDGSDAFRAEDILLRELALGIHYLAVKHVVRNFDKQLKALFDEALENGKWAGSYASRTKDSYWGEGVQSFFNVNGYARPPNGVHNDINTRSKLSTYDTGLFNLIRRIFPCGNSYIKRCNKRNSERWQRLLMDC